MRRDWGVIPGETGGEPGDHEAISRAMALANRFDGPVIEGIHDALTAMDRIGGQLVIQVYRSKYDANGQEIPREQHQSTPGQWHTDAFVFSYETRGPNLKPIVPTEAEIHELDSKAHPVPAEVVEPEPEPEPADEPEDEAA